MTSLPYRRMKSGKYELQWMSKAYILQVIVDFTLPPMTRQASHPTNHLLPDPGRLSLFRAKQVMCRQNWQQEALGINVAASPLHMLLNGMTMKTPLPQKFVRQEPAAECGGYSVAASCK